MIKHEGDTYVLYSQDGAKKLGTFDSKEAAEEREREIQAIQHAKEGHVPRGAAEVDEQGREESGVFVREVDPTGGEWDVRILKFGTSKNGWVWTPAVAGDLLRHLDGAKVGMSADRAARAIPHERPQRRD